MGKIDISAFVRRPLRGMAIRDTTLEKHQLNTLPSKALVTSLAVSKLDVVDPSIVLDFFTAYSSFESASATILSRAKSSLTAWTSRAKSALETPGDWNNTMINSLPEPFGSTRMELRTVIPDASVTS